jgi:hypothetical protein
MFFSHDSMTGKIWKDCHLQEVLFLLDASIIYLRTRKEYKMTHHTQKFEGRDSFPQKTFVPVPFPFFYYAGHSKYCFFAMSAGQ